MSKPYIQCVAIENAHKSDIYTVCTTDLYTITGSADGTLCLWDNSKTTPQQQIIATNTLGFHHVATDGNGDLIVAVGFDGKIQIIETKTMQNVQLSINENIKGCWAIALDASGKKLAVTNAWGNVYLYNLETDSLEHTFTVPKTSFGVSVDISSNAEYIVSGHENGGLYLFSAQTGRLIYSLLGHSSPIRSVKISPSSSLLAVSDDSGTVYLYHIESGEYYLNLHGHETWVMTVCWNETEEYLLSGAYDGKLKVWSIESRTCVCTQTALKTPVFATSWLKKGWGYGVIGGKNHGFVAAGVGRSLVWFREAAGE